MARSKPQLKAPLDITFIVASGRGIARRRCLNRQGRAPKLRETSLTENLFDLCLPEDVEKPISAQIWYFGKGAKRIEGRHIGDKQGGPRRKTRRKHTIERNLRDCLEKQPANNNCKQLRVILNALARDTLPKRQPLNPKLDGGAGPTSERQHRLIGHRVKFCLTIDKLKAKGFEEPRRANNEPPQNQFP